MPWALLVLLGIPARLIGVLLLAAIRNRQFVISDPGVFNVKEEHGDAW